jgi:hypothetical protein
MLFHPFSVEFHTIERALIGATVLPMALSLSQSIDLTSFPDSFPDSQHHDAKRNEQLARVFSKLGSELHWNEKGSFFDFILMVEFP